MTNILRLALITTISIAFVTAGKSQLANFPPDQAPWPKASPESQGFSSEKLAQARELMMTDSGDPFSQAEMIIIRQGYDIYHYGDHVYQLQKGLQKQNDWASCARSLMATMFGMFLRENELGTAPLELPVNEVFNSTVAREMDDTILLKHLISYTSCADPPGSDWKYACNYFPMYKIIRDAYGKSPSHKIRELAELIGAQWEPFEYWGHNQDVPFLTITATPADAARWGYLWLHQGNWNGTQVVDSAFVIASVQPIKNPVSEGFAHPHEGMQIHLNRGMWGDKIPNDAFAAFGAGGRIIFVCPSLDLVIASITTPSAYQKQMIDGLQIRDIRNLMEPIIAAMNNH
ncbi:MAG: hypothetical protein AAF944_16660 [Bacteroidota bacterium]